MIMDSLKLVVPPQPALPSSSQDTQLPSDVGHEGHVQQMNSQLRTPADGILRRQASKPATPMAKHPPKVDVDVGKQGPSQQARKSGRESTLRTILTTVSDFFKRQRTQKVVPGVAEHPEIDQLRRQITVLQNRCANLEGADYSVYGSRRSSTLDILQSLRKPDADMSRSIVSRSEDSESKHAITDVVVQANAIPSETNDQAVPASQGLTGAEGYANAKDVNVAVQPTIPLAAAKDEPSSQSLHQNLSGVASTTHAHGPTAAVRADRGGGHSEIDSVLGVQFSQTDQHKLPRKKKEHEELGAEVMAESEAQSGYIDQQRLPRKKQGNEELEVETLPPPVHQERLPRKPLRLKESGELH